MNKHKNILESLLKGSPEDTEVKSLLINNMLLLDIMFKKYPELKSVAVDLFCSYEVPRKTTGKIEELLEQKLTIGKTKYEYPTNAMLMGEINELVDAVNELKGANIEHKDKRKENVYNGWTNLSEL